MSVRSLLGKTIFPEYRLNSENKPWGLYFSKALLADGLILEGLIFDSVYLVREICVSKSIGPAL